MGVRNFNYFDCIRITEDVPELPSAWPAKLVETQFVYKGQPYHYFPDDIGLERRNSWDEGLMEWLQSKIQKDLEAVGATDVFNIGFLD